MPKYARLREVVARIMPDRLALPEAATDDQLARVHDRRYIAAVMSGTLDDAAQRRIGFPWSVAMVERSRRSTGATIAACRTALADGMGDDAYLAALGVALPRAIAQARPQLAIYLAGADPYAGDRLGRLALSKRGLAARDAFVLDTLRAGDIPVAIAMAGGYANDVDDTVDIHVATIRLALERFDTQAVLESVDADFSRYASAQRIL